MLSLRYLWLVCSPRTVLHSKRPLTSGLSVSKAVTCSGLSFSNKDTWHCSMTVIRAPAEERWLSYCNSQINPTRTYCSGEVTLLNCWNCEQSLDTSPAFFCKSCKVVQPPEEGASFFKIMDCDYSFTMDTQKLQKRYLQLQRSLHPDNFSQKSVREQEYSENQSALVNKAYKTLLKPLSRGLYMLELEGMCIEEGTDSGADSQFLMELMEINEALDEAQTPEEANKIGHDTKGKLADLTEQIDVALQKGELHAAKALLVQMKYHANIQEKVKEKLSHFM